MLLSLRALFLVFLLQSFVLGQNFYDHDSNIIELTPKTFDKVIHRTNYTSVVEFYAPWCGHCQQLKGKMKKVAKSLDGIVQVASVNCDQAKNKQLCAKQKIKGYPTIMVFRPPKIDMSNSDSQQTVSRYHVSEIYNGERKLTAIVDFALSRMKNYVKRLGGLSKLKAILDGSPRKKLLLFSHRETTSPIFKSIALDWLSEFDCYSVSNDKLKPLVDSSLLDSYPNVHQSLVSLVPNQRTSEKSLLILLDPLSDTVHIYKGGSFTKLEISKFLSETFDVKPREGPLSKREQFLDYLKNGKKKFMGKDENKKKSKKRFHDEL